MEEYAHLVSAVSPLQWLCPDWLHLLRTGGQEYRAYPAISRHVSEDRPDPAMGSH